MKAVGQHGFQQMVYFPEGIRLEIAREAKRLDRSVNWMVRKAWELAREQIRNDQPLGAEPARGTSKPAPKSHP